ncbi:DUF6907 domain-containing protein [Streptomyces sp. NPDC058394]|uniref:DUF6907 domain-containing protein n=1 Tax=Streptomyces sp. NPDC058394 TaxID=3346477 RepID=UPI0036599CDE
MSAPRTVAVPTLDHGPVTSPARLGARHTKHPVECRAVLAHAGAEGVMTHDGELLHFAELVQYPCGRCARRHVGVYVERFGFAQTLASAELEALAAALVDHAAQAAGPRSPSQHPRCCRGNR